MTNTNIVQTSMTPVKYIPAMTEKTGIVCPTCHTVMRLNFPKNSVVVQILCPDCGYSYE